MDPITGYQAAMAGIQVVQGLFGANKAKNDAIRQMNAQSKAEGQAITTERLNRTVQNSYSTAFQQMQLALQKRQAVNQSAEVSAGTLVAKSQASLNAGASGTVGASVQAIASDIDQKSSVAQDSIRDNVDNAIQNYNRDIDTMVLNTKISEPQMRNFSYSGPSFGQSVLSGAVQGLGTFGEAYFKQQLKKIT